MTFYYYIIPFLFEKKKYFLTPDHEIFDVEIDIVCSSNIIINW